MKGSVAVGLLAVSFTLTAGEKAAEPVRFYANARVVLDEQGVPQQVQANEKLPAVVRGVIEERVLRWRFEPARVGGVAKTGVTHVFMDACAVPLPDGGMRMALDYRSNGPALAQGALFAAPPRYPVDAARMAREGRFRVVINVGQDGTATVGSIDPLEGSLKPFEKTLRDWVAAMRYVPEQVDGVPIATQLAIPVDFAMGGGMGMRRAERAEKEQAAQSPECRAASAGGTDPQRPVVLDSPFKPRETG
ncbi:energy transducer TonB [uncultured Pseudoxanthomonas sp.]|uniref:energy transducer TonB n=1 Tax=uncultured Pseudoxanthomonas sp. TaxID=281701 RepID=UPI0026125CF0|nr:energy transducer TonB [uncultured Pseudoxanthomonas sp.]